MEQKQQITTQAEVLTPDLIKATANIALTKAQVSLQALYNKAASIVPNEDNIEELRKVSDQLKVAIDIVEAEHARIKEPILRQSQLIDKSKRDMVADINTVRGGLLANIVKIAADIDRKKAADERERKRVADIKNGIETNILEFSQRIAGCNTTKELTSVQSLINLQRTNKKYEEFLPLMIERLDGLNNLINKQKDRIKELEKLEKKLAKTEDEEEFQKIEQKKEDIKDAMEETKIVVQEQAINQATTTSTPVTQTEYATVKPKRTTWKFKITDLALLQKKFPQWVKVVVDEEAIKDFLRDNKDKWDKGHAQNMYYDGITFFKEKTY